MKYRYRVTFENGDVKEVEASDIWIALCKSGAILKAESVCSVQRLDVLVTELDTQWVYTDTRDRIPLEVATS